MAGGGVGEAMLIGAAMGGGSAALTGGDPLKGALLGGLTGGAGAGIGGALGGAAGGAEGVVAAAAPEAAGAAGGAGGATGTAIGASLPPSGGISALDANGFGNAAAFNPPVSAPVAPIPTAAISPVPSGGMSALDANGLGSTAGYTGSAPNAVPSAVTTPPAAGGTFTEGMQRFVNDPMASINANRFTAGTSALAGAVGARKDFQPPDTSYNGPLSRFKFNPDTYRSAFAEGGITNLASGGYDRMIGEQPDYPFNMAHGGIADLGSYSDGGRMLRGPGDGMSDSIPGVINGKRPARLADGEFVVPADVVSHLGNGSTDAGAKHLYSMMDKVRQARTGHKFQGREINANKYVPA